MSSFLKLKVVKIKPQLVFGSKGELEYFAVSKENRLLGSMLHAHIRRVGEKEKSLMKRPYHTWLVADAPENLLNPEVLSE